MPTFVQLVTFHSQTAFDMKKDTRTMNEVLGKLQKNVARIQSIAPTLTGKPDVTAIGGGSAIAVFLITYEADKEISV